VFKYWFFVDLSETRPEMGGGGRCQGLPQKCRITPEPRVSYTANQGITSSNSMSNMRV
jgi:hypothetical protein